MNLLIVLYILLVLHFAACICSAVLIKLGILEVPPYFLPIFFFVPVWGEIAALSCHFLRVTGKDGSIAPGVERLEVEEEIYKSLIPEQEEDSAVVPLEEALLLNDSGIRRSMILDILSKQPEEYLYLLKEARENSDVEVVHYATTAMSELSKEYDLKLQKLEAAYSANQGDMELLKEYCGFLKEYIDKEMAQGQFLRMQRNQYSLLLQRLIDTFGSLEFYVEKVENELAMENYEESARLLEEMEKKWDHLEEFWLLKIRHFAQQMEGGKVKEVIRELEQKDLYLTAEGKSVVEFWSKGGAGL